MKSPFPAVDTTDLTSEALIDTKWIPWRQPYIQTEPAVFYYSFNPPSVPALPKGLMSSPINSDKTKLLIRSILQNMTTYANVEMIEHDDWHSLPQNAIKVSFATSSLLDKPTTYNDYLEILTSGKKKVTNNIMGTTISLERHGNTLTPLAPGSEAYADAKIILFPKDALRHTSEGHMKQTIIHEVFHTLGLGHPCENIIDDRVTKKRIKPTDREAAIVACDAVLHRNSIMAYKPRLSTDKCIIAKLGKSTFDFEEEEAQLRPAFKECHFPVDPSPIKEADIEALKRILGPVKVPGSSNSVNHEVSSESLINTNNAIFPKIFVNAEEITPSSQVSDVNTVIGAVVLGYVAEKLGMPKRAVALTTAAVGIGVMALTAPGSFVIGTSLVVAGCIGMVTGSTQQNTRRA